MILTESYKYMIRVFTSAGEKREEKLGETLVFCFSILLGFSLHLLPPRDFVKERKRVLLKAYKQGGDITCK